MQAIKTQAWIEADGEFHLKGLPCKKQDYVEVIILIPDQPTEEERQKAFLIVVRWRPPAVIYIPQAEYHVRTGSRVVLSI